MRQRLIPSNQMGSGYSSCVASKSPSQFSSLATPCSNVSRLPKTTMFPNLVVTNGELLSYSQLGMNNRLAVEFAEEDSVFVVGCSDFHRHPLTLAGRPSGKFDLDVVSRIIASQASPRRGSYARRDCASRIPHKSVPTFSGALQKRSYPRGSCGSNLRLLSERARPSYRTDRRRFATLSRSHHTSRYSFFYATYLA